MCAKWLLDAPAFSSNFAVHGWLSINSVPKFQNSKRVLLGWKVNSVAGCDEGSFALPNSASGGNSATPSLAWLFPIAPLEFWNFGTELILSQP